MTEAVYIDTSVLVKWYVTESYSDAVEAFLTSQQGLTLSALSVLEWHCAMRRRERTGAFDARYRLLAEREFVRQLADGLFKVTPLSQSVFDEAQQLIEQVEPIALRTLDALHLALAHASGVKALATADRVMADAASRLNFHVHYFND